MRKMRKIIALLVCLMITVASLHSEDNNNIVRYDYLSETSYIVLFKYEDGSGYFVGSYDTTDLTRRVMYYMDECEEDNGVMLKFYTDLIDRKAWRNFIKEFDGSEIDDGVIVTIWKVHQITTPKEL